MKVRKVCTCLPEDDYINALLHNISFAEALRIGLRIKLGEEDAEEKLGEEIREINNMMAYKQKRLLAVRQKKQEEALQQEREKLINSNKCFLCELMIQSDKKIMIVGGKKVQLHQECAKINHYPELKQKIEIQL